MALSLRSFVFAAITFGIVAPDQQAGAPRDAQPATPTPGTAVMAGTVTAADSGRTVRRARVMLENDRNVLVGNTSTDEQGRFTFTSLPAGSYTLRASRSGFLEVIYGQRKPGSGRAGTPIQLASAQRLEKLALALPRGGVISGVVTEEIGDPVSAVPVRALRSILRNGVRVWEPVATTWLATDDRGQYRIFGLLPGAYLVCAAPRDELAQAALQAESLRRRMEEIQAAAAAQGGQTPETKMMMERMNASALPPTPKEAYVPVCAPGTPQLSGAATVTIDVSEERAGVGVQLQLLPIARVSGSVTWSGGRLPVGNTAGDTYVSLSTPQAIPGGVTYGMHVPANGQFSILNVPAGTYTLTARAMAPTALWASTEIAVTGERVTDLALSMQPGLSVSGRVVVEGAASVDIQQMRITALIAGEIAGEIAPVIASPDASGQFTLEGVVPGRYRIGAYPSSPGATNIKSSVFNGRDTLDFPLDVRPGEAITGGVLTVIPRLAEITGQLQHDANQPATGYTVIAFTADQQYWTPQSRRVQAVRPATDGRYSFRSLPGGEYRLVAVTDVEPGQWFDPAFLRELLPASIPLTLAEGERREQTLRVVGR